MDKPRVKPLVWSEWDENSNYPSCDALGAFSLWYFIDTSEARHGEPDFPLFKKTCVHTPRKRLSEHHSVEDAKATAQADYEAHILAALEPVDIPKKTLKPLWQNALNEMMEKAFPDVIGDGTLVQSWRDGCNDDTTTLFGVYLCGTQYIMCVFPDYEEPRSSIVKPRFEHSGWDVADNRQQTP